MLSVLFMVLWRFYMLYDYIYKKCCLLHEFTGINIRGYNHRLEIGFNINKNNEFLEDDMSIKTRMYDYLKNEKHGYLIIDSDNNSRFLCFVIDDGTNNAFYLIMGQFYSVHTNILNKNRHDGKIIKNHVDNYFISLLKILVKQLFKPFNSESFIFLDNRDYNVLPDFQDDKIKSLYDIEERLVFYIKEGRVEKAIDYAYNISEKFTADILDIKNEHAPHSPVRAGKNFLLVMNGILRRSLYEVGVPASMVVKYSKKYGMIIEETDDLVMLYKLFFELVEVYASQVLKFNIKTEDITIKKAYQYIIENIYYNIKLKEIADYVNLTPNYLTQKFKTLTGSTVIIFMLKKKIEFSKEDLKYSSRSIVDISTKYGFTDSSYYTKQFKRYEGITPTEYRKKCR